MRLIIANAACVERAFNRAAVQINIARINSYFSLLSACIRCAGYAAGNYIAFYGGII